jgi:hypothetical protein
MARFTEKISPEEQKKPVLIVEAICAEQAKDAGNVIIKAGGSR